MSTLSYLCLIVFIASSNTLPIEDITRATPEEYRLPEGVIGDAIHYDLELNLGADLFDSNTYTGTLKLSFNIAKDTKEIKIHAGQYVEFTSVALLDSEDKDIQLTNSDFTSDRATEIVTITISQVLRSGETYTLNIAYTAALITNDLQGFYKSTYKTENGTEVPLATTQFQTTYARRAFPCFDEPSFKATFDIKIRHIREYNALGNTNGTAVEDLTNPDFTITTFVRTPKMPTYLIAFVVSDFTCSEAEGASVPHRICSRSDTESIRKVALEFGPQLVDALQNYTGVPYTQESITKIDQAAIPDFSAGAMENWGLATYRETALLWDEVESTNRNKQSVVTIIAHELAHMWFGDLVTTHWWSDTFLNEGFATFFEYFAAHEVPATKTWALDKQFVISNVQPVLQIDSSKSSQPLSWPAFTPTEVSGRFGTVSYNKGGSVFRMVQHVMGTDNFKNGLQKYLETNKFGNAKPENLWASLSNIDADFALPEDETLENVMKGWVILPGYPVLNVTSSGNSVTVSQKRFYTDGSPLNETERWFVPITYTTSSDSDKFKNTSTRMWLRPKESSVSIQLKSTNDWIILNNLEVGYYRVLYDDVLYKKISEALNKDNFDGISDLNRAQLIDDFFNFVRADIKTNIDLLEFVKFLKHDSSYYSWYPAFTAFNTIISKIGNSLVREAISGYILDLMESLIKAVPFNVNNDDDQVFTLNKILALTWACRLGGQDCADGAVAALQAYKNTKQKPSSNLRPVIYCNGLRYSENAASDWNFLWGELLSAEVTTERSSILTALGCSKDESVLNGYLEKSINAASGLKQQDMLNVFSAVYSNNPEGVDVAFDFLATNYRRIADNYGSINSVGTLISNLANRFTRQEQADKLEKFVENTDDLTEIVVSLANNALQIAKANIKSIEEFEAELKIYFDLEEKEETSSTPTTTPTTPTTKPSSTSETPTTAGAAELKSKFNLFNIAVYIFIYLSVFYNS